MRLGIFGGSFNPPHNVHKNIALKLIDNKYLDKVIYVPTGDKYKKDGLVSAQDRYNMVEIMIKDNPNLLISDYELKNVLTRTFETLDYFKGKYPNDDIYFICGTDNLKQIETWKNYEYILYTYKLLVIKRNGDYIEPLLNKYNMYKKNIIITNIKEENLSSTLIRNYLKDDKVDSGLIEQKVLKYIREKNLYI